MTVMQLNTDFEHLIIGAGVVGLACAAELSLTSTPLLLEAESSYGRHTSSRNSEVLHSGIYYPPDSLKARLCLEGNRRTKDWCTEHQLPCCETGKYVVAMNEDELPRLFALLDQGRRNGVSGLSLVKGNELPADLAGLRPVVRALWVPSAAVIDSHRFMASLEQKALAGGSSIVYGTKVTGIEPIEQGYRLHTDSGDTVTSRHVINCAGLQAHQLSAMAGIDPLRHRLIQHWCKGVYFKTSRLGSYPSLIYPIPPADGQSLGIHLTVNIAGEVRFGPDTEFVDCLDYRFPENRRDVFFKAVSRYLDLSPEDLSPDDTGIRAKLQGPGEPFRDFYIREESNRNRPGFVNCIGIESPGLTSALAIAGLIGSMLT